MSAMIKRTPKYNKFLIKLGRLFVRIRMIKIPTLSKGFILMSLPTINLTSHCHSRRIFRGICIRLPGLCSRKLLMSRTIITQNVFRKRSLTSLKLSIRVENWKQQFWSSWPAIALKGYQKCYHNTYNTITKMDTTV